MGGANNWEEFKEEKKKNRKRGLGKR